MVINLVSMSRPYLHPPLLMSRLVLHLLGWRFLFQAYFVFIGNTVAKKMAFADQFFYSVLVCTAIVQFLCQFAVALMVIGFRC